MCIKWDRTSPLCFDFVQFSCSVPQFPHLQKNRGLTLTPKVWFLKISYNLLCRIISNVLMCVSQIPGHTVISLRTETGHFPFLVFSLHFSAHYTLNKLTPLTDNHTEHLGGSKERCAYSSWPLLKIRGTSRPRCLNDVNIWPRLSMKKGPLPPIQSAGAEQAGLVVNTLWPKASKDQKHGGNFPLPQSQGVTSKPSIHRRGGWDRLSLLSTLPSTDPSPVLCAFLPQPIVVHLQDNRKNL